MEDLWITIVACGVSFICGMWLRDRILTWIGQG